ncbi:MAG TPA: adenylyl-sulfate kinase [Anaeromyxobacter sp.]|nr:adenylyl-sulfate kinase [Anaeromyxobacter sp.]
MSGAVVWVTGLPASGKTTLARRIRDRLRARGVPATLLDGDAIRAALAPAAGYDPAGRAGFYETLGNLALALADDGVVAVVAATAHRRAFRDRVRARLSSGPVEGEGAPRFVEVFVDVPPEVCAARDPKGLWAKARAGDAPDLPGAAVPYERPLAPEVVAGGGEDGAAVEAAAALVAGAS